LAIGFIFFYRFLGKKTTNWKIDPALVSYLFRNSWPFILSGISTVIYSQIDQVLLRVFINGQTVGIYAVASNLSEPWSFIPGLLCSSLFPAIINARKTDTRIFGRRMSALYSLVFYIALAIAIPITILSPVIIHVLYGAAYAGSAPLLSICIWSIVGMSLSIALQQYLIAENKLVFVFTLNFIGMLCNLCLNLILIPKIGAAGAAISNSVSYIFPVIMLLMLPSLKDQARVFIKGLFLRFT
jgi:O-antigen/teichoic acid export membrane protein